MRHPRGSGVSSVFRRTTLGSRFRGNDSAAEGAAEVRLETNASSPLILVTERGSSVLERHDPPRISGGDRRGGRRWITCREHGGARSGRRCRVLRQRQAVRQRQPAAFHGLPRAAQADLLPRAQRQPGRRRCVGQAARISSASICSSISPSPPARATRTRSRISTSRGPRRRTARWAGSRIWPRW